MNTVIVGWPPSVRAAVTFSEIKQLSMYIQGDPSARGPCYVDISSVSYGCYPEMELMTT